MIKIYKYPLDLKKDQTVRIQGLLNVLSVVPQKNTPVLYAAVDTTIQASLSVRVKLYETGQEIEPETRGYTFLGTLMLDGADYVLHAFVDHTGEIPGL